MRRWLIVAVLFLAAAPLFATEAIVLTLSPAGVSPNGGFVLVRSNGVRFGQPTAVYFDNVAVAPYQKIDDFTLLAYAPSHKVGLVNVHVQDGNNSLWATELFGYGVSDWVMVPVAGDSASGWSTEIRVYNGTDHDVPIDPEYCTFIGAWFPCSDPVTRIPPRSSTLLTGRGRYGWEILNPPLQDTASIHYSVHVRNVAHPELPPIEIPTFHQRELLTGSMVLASVPTSDRFRSNLRVFSGAGLVTVTLFDSTTGVPVDSRSVQRYFPTDVSTFDMVNFRDLFTPAQVRAHERVDIVIDASEPYDRHWALLTLTDSATQQVTTWMPH